MPQGQKRQKFRKKARARAAPYALKKQKKTTKKGAPTKKPKTAKGRKATSQAARKAAGTWTRNFEMMAAGKLLSTGATLAMGDLKGLAKLQARHDRETALTRKNKTRAAQVERKAARLVASAKKELEELRA